MYSLMCACLIISCVFGHEPRNNKSSNTDSKNGPVRVTPMGRIRGSWMESRKGARFEAYRGIPYAKPPVGDLRFQPPQALEHYEFEVDASSEGPACPMPVAVDYYLDEDCLRLNVYTTSSRRTKKLKPVVVFIHPGAFYSFSGRSDVAGPHYLMDRDLVLVTLNYRLASLGFMSTGDELAPGNNGLKDQVVALRWVKKNIEAFGGDPNLVTITGCSAGSTSVMLHMVSPMSKGLFQRAISISGSPMTQGGSPNHQKHLAMRQAELLNCPTSSSKAIIDCLKTKHWKEIADTLNSFFEFGYDPILLWQPVVEKNFGQERFLTAQPTTAIIEGNMHAVPYIISQTEAELFWKAFTVLKNITLLNTMNAEWDRVAPISFLLPSKDSRQAAERLRQVYLHDRQVSNDTRGATELGSLYADSAIGFPVYRLADLMSQYSPQPVYYYVFSYVGNHSHYEDPITKKPTAAAHQDDMIYLFSLPYRFPNIPVTGEDATMVDRMTALVYTFARYGNPNPQGDLPELSSLCWPPMDPVNKKYLQIAQEFSVHEKYAEDRFKVWDELYPIES